MSHPFAINPPFSFSLSNVREHSSILIPVTSSEDSPGPVFETPAGTWLVCSPLTRSVIRACYMTGIPTITPASLFDLRFRLHLLLSLSISPTAVQSPEGPVPHSFTRSELSRFLGLTTSARPLPFPEFLSLLRSAFHSQESSP